MGTFTKLVIENSVQFLQQRLNIFFFQKKKGV